jgi:hypothetical protein
VDVAASSLNVRSLTQEAINDWPGASRRDPARSDPLYLVFRPLADQIRDQMVVRFGARRDLHVVDVGCGVKPFFPLIAPWAESYRGLDAAPGPKVDDVGRAERLPYPNEEFDLVLCT